MVWVSGTARLFSTNMSAIFHNCENKSYSISAYGMADQRTYINFVLDEDLKDGEYDIPSKASNVSATYSHQFPDSGWNFHAVSGKLTIIEIDLPNQRIVANFDFKAPAREEGQPMVDLKDGKIDISGPK
jgi:hypothetical protein